MPVFILTVLMGCLPSQRQPFDHETSRAARVGVTVSDADGNPVQGATTLVRSEDTDGVVEFLGRGVSDSAGDTELRLTIPSDLDGDLQVKIFHPDYGFTTVPDSVVDTWLASNGDLEVTL